MADVLIEITPLSEKDCFHIVDRHKESFTYPLHSHREFEINFVEHGKGVRRVVGDHIEEIQDYDLVLICGENLEHVWETGSCQCRDIREITIQFSPNLIEANLLSKNQFAAISKMFRDADHGVAFPIGAIMKVYQTLNSLASESEKFRQFLDFLWILNELAHSEYQILASSSFAHAERNQESRRVLKVKQYINDHYKEPLRLGDLAALVGMSEASFSRFFKLRSGKSLSDYVIEIRLGFASRQLIDSSKNVAEICYDCGLNNLSNFNRIFRAKRGMTPRDFRAMYKKNKVTI